MSESRPNTGQNPKKQNKKPSKDHVLRKRQPNKPERGDHILYISTKTDIKAHLEKCNKLISNNENEIILYCLGAAIQRGILLAMKICERHVTYKIHANTFSTELTDDLEPATDSVDYEIQRRINSALRIKIFNSIPNEDLPAKASTE
ncbi:unnamed protein product [Acanthoscelides obtectus]|uniref:Uncharacterized protein n=1 Tax=Acanthoscelides obtectus TaxID=200917 RepID=A0A9P0L5Q6_ACAOB|nr:unnamed protein product [Acanthoscelides obtectus]CAK1626720.1 Ribonuclease P protein subunit p20 [Acanthoscelides obtectus]